MWAESTVDLMAEESVKMKAASKVCKSVDTTVVHLVAEMADHLEYNLASKSVALWVVCLELLTVEKTVF